MMMHILLNYRIEDYTIYVYIIKSEGRTLWPFVKYPSLQQDTCSYILHTI